jgi:hypothetical protein
MPTEQVCYIFETQHNREPNFFVINIFCLYLKIKSKFMDKQI